MASTKQITQYKWSKPLRIARVRWRLFFAAGVGLFAFVLMPVDWRLISRVLMGWDIWGRCLSRAWNLDGHSHRYQTHSSEVCIVRRGTRVDPPAVRHRSFGEPRRHIFPA